MKKNISNIIMDNVFNDLNLTVSDLIVEKIVYLIK